MSFKLVLKVFLWLQLLALVLRQIIDFCGIQWLMIVVNAIAIIVTICALFKYLLIHFLFQFLLIVYNQFVIAFYLGFFGPNYSSVLSFDSNSRSFWSTIVSHLFQTQKSNDEIRELESIVDYIEISQSSIHLLLSLVLIVLLVIRFRNRRKQLLKQNSKTTPPLPPYTISALNLNNNAQFHAHSIHSTMNSSNSSMRRKRRQRSSQRMKARSKLLINNESRENVHHNYSLSSLDTRAHPSRSTLTALHYQCSDSETDYYQTFGGGGMGGVVGGLTNPLYLSCNQFNNRNNSETHI